MEKFSPRRQTHVCTKPRDKHKQSGKQQRACESPHPCARGINRNLLLPHSRHKTERQQHEDQPKFFLQSCYVLYIRVTQQSKNPPATNQPNILIFSYCNSLMNNTAEVHHFNPSQRMQFQICWMKPQPRGVEGAGFMPGGIFGSNTEYRCHQCTKWLISMLWRASTHDAGTLG